MMGLSIWPGHQARLSLHSEGVHLLQVMSVHQVIRTNETVLDKLKMLRESNENRGQDFKEEIRQTFAGQIVITKYNERAYRIDDVCFDKNPDSTFNIERDGEVYVLSFAEYLRLKYKVEVT